MENGNKKYIVVGKGKDNLYLPHILNYTSQELRTSPPLQ
jgi:hypothetical protein